MAVAVTMPKLGLTMMTGSVAQWNVSEGQPVAVGDVIVEVMTEKITYQVEAQAEGVLLKIVVPEEEEVPIGAVIGVIGQPGEDISALVGTEAGEARASSDAAIGGAATRILASPAAKKRAAEIGLDLAGVAGTGPGGRITADDVDRAGADVSLARAAAGSAPGGPAAAPFTEPSERGVRESVGYAGVRRAIGEHMVASWTVTPMVTHHVRVDMHGLVRLLDELNDGRVEGDRVSITAAAVKSVAAALQSVPRLNATLEGDVIRVWADVNIGVAVATPDGLIVPVVKGADGKGLAGISREVWSLAERARGNELMPDDVVGGTFTVTSLGAYRSVDWFTPIVNQQEAAILGVGRVIDEVVAVDGIPRVRPTMGLSLTFDHRIADDAVAAEFLAVLLSQLEQPLRLLS